MRNQYDVAIKELQDDNKKSAVFIHILHKVINETYFDYPETRRLAEKCLETEKVATALNERLCLMFQAMKAWKPPADELSPESESVGEKSQSLKQIWKW